MRSPSRRGQDYASAAVEIRETATGRLSHTLLGHTAEVNNLVFSPDGRRLVTASSDFTIKQWDTATGREVFTLRGHTGGVACLAFSPDGLRLASGSMDHTARVWDATPLPAHVLQEHDARYQRKLTALAELKDATDDIQRGEILARSGQWELAADAFAKAVDREPRNRRLRYQHLIALVESGNRTGVRLASAELLKRFGDATDPVEANNVAGFCRLAPDACADPKKLEALRRLCDDSATADTLLQNGLPDLAAALFEATLKLQTRLGTDHPDGGATRQKLAETYRAAGRTANLVALFEATLKLQETELGPAHASTLASVHELAHALEATRPADAEPLFRRALEGCRKHEGPDGPLTHRLTGDLAGLLDQTGRPAEAEPLLRKLLDRQRGKLPADDPALAGTLATLGKNLLSQRKWPEAEPVLRECLAMCQKALPDDWSQFNAMSMLGGSLLGQRKYGEAEPLIVAGYEGLKAREARIPAPGKPRLSEAADRLLQIYESWGKKDKAAAWRTKLARPDNEPKRRP